MDKKIPEQTFTSNASESIVGPSVKIEGDLKSNGNLKIDGVVTGKVTTSQNLYVGESANINADISAENAVINGAIQGNVKVKSALLLGRTARVNGDIFCGTLQVEEGAYFAGKCQMGEQRAAKQPIEEHQSKK